MGTIALNTELSIGNWVPIVAIQLSLAGLGANLISFQKRVILWGHGTSGYPFQSNIPYQLIGQDFCNSRFGPQSDIAAEYAHLQAQNAAFGGAGVEAWAIAVPEPSGVKATHLVKIIALPTGTSAPGVNTSALAAGNWTVYGDGWAQSGPVASGDTFAVVAASIATAFTNALAASQAPINCPITSAIAGGATVTFTANHVGLLGNDFPIRVEFSSSAMGLAASPGTLTYATNANPAGTATVTVGSLTSTTTVNNTQTPDVTATAVATDLNNGNYNVRALDNHAANPGEVVLLYAEGRVAHRISATVTGTSQAQTVTVACGTAGTGVPSLTAALTKLRANKAFRLWVNPWLDAATLGAISTHIEEMGGGLYMKGQVVHMCDTFDLVTDGAIPPSSTPKLTASPRYSLSWCADAEIRGNELAAHIAGIVLSDDQPNANYDGAPLRTSAPVPLGAPHLAVRPDRVTTCNTAMISYHLTPLVVDEDTGLMTVMRGVTTAQVADDSLSNWGVIGGLDYARFYAVRKLTERFIRPRLLLKKVGKPQSQRSVNADAVGDCLAEILDDLENGENGSFADVVDGAEELKKQIRFQVNPQVGGRIDATFPTRITPPLHQIGVVEQQIL